MDYVSIIIVGLVLGIIIGLMSRVDRLRPLAVILSLVSSVGLFVLLGNFITFAQNPSIDGMYPLIASMVPFVIGAAATAKGEELGKMIAR